MLTATQIPNPHPHPLNRQTMMVRTLWLLLVAALTIGGCSRAVKPLETHSGLAQSSTNGVDMSGNWELDYGLSDSLEHKVQMRFLEQSYYSAGSANGQRGPSIATGRSRGGLRAYARLGVFTDEITQIAEMEIQQDEAGVRVKREGDYSLTCAFARDLVAPTKGVFGSELCGWSGDELVFVAALDGGVSVVHRLRLGADGQRLSVATTVRSRGISEPFTMTRVYSRFEPLPSEFVCEQTLERGRSCRRKSG